MNSIEMSGKGGAKVDVAAVVATPAVAAAAAGRELSVADLPTGLSEKQLMVLRLIYNNQSLSEAAVGANVNRSTLFRWRRSHQGFRSAYLMVRQQMREMVKADVQSLAEDALLSLRLAVMEGDDPRLCLMVLKHLKLLGEEDDPEPVLEEKVG